MPTFDERLAAESEWIDTPPAAAVVVTHRRPRLATEAVRMLINAEGFRPAKIILVVNGEGGLEDEMLEGQVDMVRLNENLGPAGGFRAGLQRALDAHGDPWVYACEDDITLFSLPTPRVANLLRRLTDAGYQDEVGAVVAYGRQLDRSTGLTYPYLVDETTRNFPQVDVAAWGATLISRLVLERGILPRSDLFFAFEDFDFFLSIHRRGFKVLLDDEASARVQDRVFFSARDEQHKDSRPVDSDEAWRRYYVARNFFDLARTHGRFRWQLWHLFKSMRRLQRLDPDGRRAYAAGLWDGVRGRTGRNDRRLPTIGELSP